MPAVVVLEAVRQWYRLADDLGAVPLHGRGAQAREIPVPLRRRALRLGRPAADAGRTDPRGSARNTPSGPGARAGPSRSWRAGTVPGRGLAAPRRVRRGDRWAQAAVSVRGAAAVMARAAAKSARRLDCSRFFGRRIRLPTD